MDRYHFILNDISESAQKTYRDKKRSELKDSDFLFPETRSFPIVSPSDVPDAISNFGRMKSGMSYDSFLKKLYSMCKRKGKEFIDALPEASKEKLGINKSKNCQMDSGPDLILSGDPEKIKYNDMEEEEEEEEDPLDMEIEKLEKKNEPEILKQKIKEIKKTKGQDFTQVENLEKENIESEMMEYKNDFYQMSVGSLKAIMTHSQAILNSLDDEKIKENLTESWLQGRIAITEDYMRTIHDFVMFVSDDDDNSNAGSKPGLWDNIRKKKERMGKKYKPAKPGDKDRPDPEAFKKAQK